MEKLIEIRLATESEYFKIRDFYYILIDAMQDAEFKPGWKKDIYPTQEFLQESIKNQELFVAEVDGILVSCMVVNHQYNDGYNEISWTVDAADSELYVIHTLGVHPLFSGKGIAKKMVQYVIGLAETWNIKTIRLDVLEGNLPAEKAYTKVGFQYLDTIQMFYEDTGWTSFRVFEYIV